MVEEKDRLTEIKARLAKASYDARPLKLHAGCKNPPNCAVCTEYNSARQEWEAYLGDLQIKAPSDIAWLIAELEKERARVEELLNAGPHEGCYCKHCNPSPLQIETVTEFRCGTETVYKDGTKDFQWSEQGGEE